MVLVNYNLPYTALSIWRVADAVPSGEKHTAESKILQKARRPLFSTAPQNIHLPRKS